MDNSFTQHSFSQHKNAFTGKLHKIHYSRSYFQYVKFMLFRKHYVTEIRRNTHLNKYFMIFQQQDLNKISPPFFIYENTFFLITIYFVFKERRQ